MLTRCCLVFPKKTLVTRGRQVTTTLVGSLTTRTIIPNRKIVLTKRTMTTALPETFTAWRVEETDKGTFVGTEQQIPMPITTTDKKDHVLIRVTHSSLNYKDALSAAGHKGVTRHYPHTPGIDAAGHVVVNSDDDDTTYKPVLVTGYDLGMNTDGGFGEYIHVPTAWVVDMPTPWQDDARMAMIYGTAGLTAGLLVHKLLMHANAVPNQTVAVTGATGAVGSVAIEILARLGFDVVAISGKNTEQHDFLTQLGAATILDRTALETSSKPLLKPQFHHAIDTVGGAPLVELLKQLHPDGSVACCGNAAGVTLPGATVLPFILRGNALLGVDSVNIDKALKAAVWHKLAHEWACPVTEAHARDIGRHDLDATLQAIRNGQSRGKIVLNHALSK